MIKNFRGISPDIDATAFVAETAVVIGDVTIGPESSIWYGTVVRGDINSIRIGARTNIQDASVVHVSSGEFSTTLEDEVTVGHSVTLHGCYVETGSLIGIGSVLLDGVRIGRHSLVAAGSLVTPRTVIPEYSLVMGSPAVVRRRLTEKEIADLPTFWQNYVNILKDHR